ncbi:50S ribosomal protein L25 [Candidatus Uhrbacteria bacterium]|nr:50S ribosomal protein L25 [Candidatus Uhrbacteria bacterium]
MTPTLTAASRTDLGRQAKKVRDAGQIPAVMYGHGIEPKALSLGMSEFIKMYREAGSSSIIDVAIDGGAPVKALVQEIQLHPLTMRPDHVDLRQIRMDEELTVDVPLVFVNESPAVKELAGTLVRPYETLTVTCLPTVLPREIAVDLSKLKTFDDAITVADLALPEGVKVEEGTDVTIATVTPPMTEEQLKKMEEEGKADVTAVKTEAEEKKAEAEAEKAEETEGEKTEKS